MIFFRAKQVKTLTSKHMSLIAGFIALSLALLVLGCSSGKKIPEDPNLELLIKTSARCAFVDRAFSSDPDLFKEEMQAVEFPPNWREMVDSLLTAYGSDPDFWHQVYSQIVERSRK